MALTDIPVDLAPERQTPPGPMSYEAFLEWYDGAHAEWVGGEILMTSPASLPHQNLSGFLYDIVGFWVRGHDLGVVILPPFQMHLLPPVNRGREPDLIFLAKHHLERLRHNNLEGPADLVVEITSPESLQRDRREKLREYEQAGIPEYWLFDILAHQATFYELGADGRYGAAPLDATGAYVSRVLRGLQLPVAWLWQEPLPDRLDILRTLGLLG